MLLISILIFVLGLVMGSFLNVVVYRLKIGKTVVRGRSFCPECRQQLQLIDLIPVLSFVFLRRKCRHCHKKISWQYPLVELATASSFLLISFKLPLANFYLESGFGALLAGYLFFTSLLIIVFVYDLKYYLISDKIVVPGAIVAFLFSFINPDVQWWESLIGAVMVCGFFTVIILITKGKGMGWGDAKLGLMMGALLGWQISLVALFIAFVSGSVVGLLLILFKKKGWKSEVPFGTFLAAATFICLLWGQEILQWYLGIISL